MQTVAVADVVADVSAMLERIFATLESLRAATAALYADGIPPRSTDLARLRPQIHAALGGDELIVGFGYIPEVGALADRPRWLEWWKCEDDRPTRLVVELDPASEAFVDYTTQPWFTTPRATGRRHLTGPYVDYVCTDEYSLTLTVPVHHDGRFVGVVGSDVYVRGLERVLLPRLRALGGRAALVNAQGRVAVSTSVRHVTGSLVRTPDVGELWRAEPSSGVLHRCGDLPLALLEL